MIAEPTDEAALLQLLDLDLAPVAVVKTILDGTIQLIYPTGAQVLMPVARGGRLDHLFDLLSEAAPEIAEMVRRFGAATGRICDEHRVLVRSAGGPASRTHVLSLTLHEVDAAAVVGVVADVTSAVLREELVRANEARLHAVFDGVKDYGIATVDVEGKVTRRNRACEQFDGFRADEMLGHSIEMVFATTGTGRSTSAPLLERARDGDELLGYSPITRDLTERKRSEDALRRLPSTGALNRRALLEAAAGERIAERIRARVAATEVTVGAASIRVTVSVGVAALGANGDDVAGVMQAAHRAHYAAENDGRNRVVMAPA